MKTKILAIVLLAAILALGAACGPKVEPTPTVDPNAIMTQVAMTVQAEVTQMALLTPSPTATLPPTATPQPVPTLPLPTAPTSPAKQQGPAPALPADSPDNAKFVADVSVADNSVFWKNEKFTKIWKIENTGTTTWDTSYKLVFLDGAIMGDVLIVSITSPVPPKAQVEIGVPMKAPATLGTYTAWFKMMNGKGQFFGEPYSVKIVVGTELDKTVTPNG